jgi:hypothetical protein
MEYYFNKQIKYTFIPVDLKGSPMEIHSIVSAELFDANGNSVQLVDDIELDEDTLVYTISFDAVVDSDPDNLDKVKYSVKVTFVYDEDGEESYVTNTIYLYRPISFNTYLNTTVDDLYSRENKLSNEYSADSVVEAHLEAAKQELFILLSNKGYNKVTLFNFDNLTLLHIFKTLENCCRDLASDDNSSWMIKSEFYKDKFDNLLGNSIISNKFFKVYGCI